MTEHFICHCDLSDELYVISFDPRTHCEMCTRKDKKEFTVENVASAFKFYEGRISSVRKELHAAAHKIAETGYVLGFSCEKTLAENIGMIQDENNRLRHMLATSKADCTYCGLPHDQMNRCAHGFPGCGRADDIIAGETQANAYNDAEGTGAGFEKGEGPKTSNGL